MRWLVRVLVSGAIVVYVLVDVDLGDLGRALTHVHLAPVLAATALTLGSQAISAYKWSWIAEAVGFRRSLADCTRFYFIGMFFNLFGPSTVGGTSSGRCTWARAPTYPRRRLGRLRPCERARFARDARRDRLPAVPAVPLPALADPRGRRGRRRARVAWWAAPRLVRLLPATPRTEQLRRAVGADLARSGVTAASSPASRSCLSCFT